MVSSSLVDPRRPTTLPLAPADRFDPMTRRSFSAPTSRRLFVAGLVLALAASAFVAPASAADTGWSHDIEKARVAARDTERLLLVDLYADWCSWCKVLDEEVFSTAEFLRYAGDKFVLLRVDVEDGAEGQALSERFAVMSLPMTLIADPDLVKVGQVSGFLPLRSFKGALDTELIKWAAFQQRYAAQAESNDAAVLRSLADELHRRRDGARAAALYERILAIGGAGTSFSIHFLRADSYRLAGDLDAADSALAAAEQARSGEDLPPPVDEALRILRFQIASDLGECKEAKAALDTLLESHPHSAYGPTARHDLETLESASPCT